MITVIANDSELQFAENELVHLQVKGRKWNIEFCRWETLSSERKGLYFCGIRIDENERTFVRINAVFIESINGMPYQSTGT